MKKQDNGTLVIIAICVFLFFTTGLGGKSSPSTPTNPSGNEGNPQQTYEYVTIRIHEDEIFINDNPVTLGNLLEAVRSYDTDYVHLVDDMAFNITYVDAHNLLKTSELRIVEE